MAVDKNKVIADATKYVQKGQLDKAIRAYEKILAEDPNDVRVLLKLGELHQKKGDQRSAADSFGRAAEAYANQGFFLKAVAVYKQLMKLSPDDVRVNERLAGLYQQLGILSDAMAQLQLVAAAAERNGESAKLLETLRRMVDLDPDNVASAVKLGELYAKGGQTQAALGELRRAADYLRRNNRADEYLKVAERIVAVEPADVGLARELANIYLAKGDTKRALAKLQLCFKANPKDVATLNLLAQAFRDLGQVTKTISVLKELAQLYAEQGRAEDLRATWQGVMELAPDDEDAARALAAGAPPPVPAPRVPAPRVPAPRVPPPLPAARAVPPPIPGAGKVPGGEAIPKLVTETDVYLKYGLHEKALEHLAKILAIDPDHIESREKALQVKAARGDAAGAAEEAVRVARIALARGLRDRLQAAMAKLRELAPSHPELAALARATSARPAAPRRGDLEEDLVLEVEAPEEDSVALAAAEVSTDDAVEDEVARIEVAPAAQPAAPPAGAIALAPPVLAVPPAPPRPPGPAAEDDEANLDDEVAEAEFFIQRQLYDEARELLDNLLLFHPGHRKLAAKREEVEWRSAPPAPPPVEPELPEETFDIARELAEELGATITPPPTDALQFTVADVFNQFKKGVEQSVTAEDSETHYDLGIAYKEMGLLDDALHEFQVALGGRNRKKEVDCLTMLAACHMEKGQLAGAIEALRRALRSDHLTPEAARAVNYELATAYEASGDPQSALFFLQKVLRADPRYRDAQAMVARLGGGPGRPPADEAGPRPASNNGPNKNVGFV
jgi:tetratricopeptide (TPR) repeat protein